MRHTVRCEHRTGSLGRMTQCSEEATYALANERDAYVVCDDHVLAYMTCTTRHLELEEGGVQAVAARHQEFREKIRRLDDHASDYQELRAQLEQQAISALVELRESVRTFA